MSSTEPTVSLASLWILAPISALPAIWPEALKSPVDSLAGAEAVFGPVIGDFAGEVIGDIAGWAGVVAVELGGGAWAKAAVAPHERAVATISCFSMSCSFH